MKWSTKTLFIWPISLWLLFSFNYYWFDRIWFDSRISLISYLILGLLVTVYLGFGVFEKTQFRPIIEEAICWSIALIILSNFYVYLSGLFCHWNYPLLKEYEDAFRSI